MKKTIENLAKAFVGESQARNRYTWYAKTAKVEGYEQISAVFLETAEQERSHASSLWKMIQGLKKKENLDFEALTFDAEFPAVQGCTADNLKAAIAGENHETECMYPEFADVAEKEGYATTSRPGCVPSAGPRSTTRPSTRSFWRWSSRAPSSRRRRRPSGCAGSAVTSTRARNRRRSARPASTPAPTSSADALTCKRPNHGAFEGTKVPGKPI